jgi:hypothetical protein
VLGAGRDSSIVLLGNEGLLGGELLALCLHTCTLAHEHGRKVKAKPPQPVNNNTVTYSPGADQRAKTQPG